MTTFRVTSDFFYRRQNSPIVTRYWIYKSEIIAHWQGDYGYSISKQYAVKEPLKSEISAGAVETVLSVRS